MGALAQTDLLAWLTGTWSVDRAINGRAHAFTGTAEFMAQGDDRLRWEEHGRLVLGAYSGPASRVLLIVRDPAGSGHEVFFDDGRLFHALDLAASARCAAEHPCGPDLYRGTYAVEGDDVLRVVWHVEGPGRADVIESVYRRAG
jgi:hypothetical protein